MQTVIDATQKETAIDQQQQLSCEMLIRQHHQTILWLLSSAAMASTWWRVRELYCPTKYITTSRLITATDTELLHTDQDIIKEPM